jgi:hypothetical protein
MTEGPSIIVWGAGTFAGRQVILLVRGGVTAFGQRIAGPIHACLATALRR